MEREQREDKEKEKELRNKIRDFRRNLTRRAEPTSSQMPAIKKRKLTSEKKKKSSTEHHFIGEKETTSR